MEEGKTERKLDQVDDGHFTIALDNLAVSQKEVHFQSTLKRCPGTGLSATVGGNSRIQGQILNLP